MSTKKPKTVVKIEIETPPSKIHYFSGELFDPTGMVVRAYFDDNTNSVVTLILYSPTGPLKINDNSVTVTYLGKSAIKSITVNDRFIIQNIKNAEIGDGPFYNLFDFSLRFVSDTISVSRDSFSLPFNVIYHSRMSSVLSNKVLGLPDRFKTNYHQLLIRDGYDSNDDPIYKYIDGDGYVHSFYKTTDHIYFCNEDNSHLVVDVNGTSFYAEIIDSNCNKLLFNNNGFLYQIIDGYDYTNIKNISYSNDKIAFVYDSRDSTTYIQYSYDLSHDRLSVITFIYRNETIKTLTFNYDNDGFLINVMESANNQSRTLYNFSYNSVSSNSSFDHIDLIEDCLVKKAYRFSYSLNSVFNDYVVDSFETGYLNSNHVFVAQKSLTRSSYSVRYYEQKLPNEVRLINQNNKELAFSLDRNANITAVFGDPNGDQYKTIYKEKGIPLTVTGDTNVYVNSSRFISLSGTTFSLSLTNEARSLFKEYDNFVLRFYLRLNGYYYKRVKITITADPSCIFPSSIDINVNQCEKYQLVEIPFSKCTLISLFSPTSFIFSIVDEYGLNVNAYAGDFYFDKSSRATLKFLGGSYSFDDVTDIGVYDSYNDLEPVRKISLSGATTFSIEDFLKTFKHPNNCFQGLLSQYEDQSFTNKKPIYLNNGRAFDFYSYRFTLFAGDAIVFNSINPGNVDLDSSSNTWFFVTATADNKTITKTYYRYANNDFQSVSRTITNNNSHTWKEEIRSFNPITEKLIKVTNGRKFLNVIVSSDTDYEYFTNGELKKVTQTFGELSTMLYEASQDSNGYISRKTSGLSSSDIIYNKYLESVVTHNTVNNGVISNSVYKKELTYDNYLSAIDSVAFKYSTTNRGTNHLDVDYANNESSLYVNTNPLYKLSNNASNTISTLKRYNGYAFDDVLSIEQTDLLNEVIYYGSSNTVITNTFDTYGRITEQSLNNQSKVSFNYQTNLIECPSSAQLSYVVDGYINKTTLYSYNDYNHSETIDLNNGFAITKLDSGAIYYSFDDEAIYHSVAYSDIAINVYSNSNHLVSFSTSYIHDVFNRLSNKNRAGDDNNSTTYLSDNYSYGTNGSLPSSFSHVDELNDYTHVSENYSYDTFGNVSSIVTTFRDAYDNIVRSVSYTRTFSYDGFNRIVEEENNLLQNSSRGYRYDEKGRMTIFGSNQLSYNSMDQLTSFGSTTFTYDHYGNRISKTIGNNVTYYSYERGKLLSSITANGRTVTFTYDYLGRRYQKDSYKETVTYFYDDNRLIGENHVGKSYLDENNNLQTGLTFQLRFFYHLDGALNGVRLIYIYNNDTYNEDYAYIVNSFNEIVGLSRIYTFSSTPSSSLDVNYIYDAWGNHKVYNALGQESIDYNFIGYLNPFRYKGYYYDQETELYYLLSRYYDPSIAQFISLDDYSYLNVNSISGYHLYAYCNNNPVMYFDKHGRIAISAIIGVIVGVLVGFSIAAYADYQNDGLLFNQGDGDPRWYDYIGSSVIGGLLGYCLAGASGLSLSFTYETFVVTGTEIVVVSNSIAISGTGIIAASGLFGLVIMATKIGKSGGYRIDHYYPDDHGPIHVHVYGDDIHNSHGIRVGLDKEPLDGEPPLPFGARKALKRLWKEILRALSKWMQ